MPSTANRGFTLIELMVVVAVIAILAAIAFPSFNNQARKARRADAISNLKSVQLQLEKWRVDHSSYDGTPASLLTGFSTTHYTYAVSGASATGYTITATAKGSQLNDSCGNLSVVKNGAVVENKTSTNASGCW